MPRLDEIKLYSNRIKFDQPKAFKMLNSLKILNLSSQNISSFNGIHPLATNLLENLIGENKKAFKNFKEFTN